MKRAPPQPACLKFPILKTDNTPSLLKHALCGRVLFASLACFAYMASASTLILLNKYILSVDGFAFPMALGTLGMGFSSIAAHAYCQIWDVEVVHVPAHEFMTKFLPVGLFMAVSLYTGNLVWVMNAYDLMITPPHTRTRPPTQVYLYLTVAFVQMLKALCPAVTMLTSFMFQLEKPSLPLIASVLIITCGIGIASFAEVNFVIIGVLIMLLSIQADALRLVLIQYVLTNHSMHPMQALKYLAPACTFWMVMGTVFVEYSDMLESNAFGKMHARPWLYMTAAAMGFLVNSTCYLAIKLTSSLTIKVVGAAKDTGIVLCSIFMLHEHVSPMQWLGYSGSMVGFGLYNYVKFLDAQHGSEQNLGAMEVPHDKQGKVLVEDGVEEVRLLLDQERCKSDVPHKSRGKGPDAA